MTIFPTRLSALPFYLLLILIMSSQVDDAEASTSASPSTPSTKKIYLIRHAESEENRRIAALSRTFQRLKKFSLPTTSELSTSTELLNVSAQVDSDVSEIGTKQIAHMGEKLQKDNFVESSGIELAIHSPLLRARQTSLGMLGCMTASSTDSTIEERKAASVSRVAETALLLEKKPAEWTPMYFGQFRQRIAEFEAWLGTQPEETIAIVGHSQFFKAMLGLDEKFGNCEVWKVDFVAPPPQAETPEELPPLPSSCWSKLEKVHSCEVESSPKTV